MLLLLIILVQVICEVLPVSSSGHVSLLLAAAKRYGYAFEITEHFWALDFFLQAVSAVVFLLFFFSAWWKLSIKKPISLEAFFDTSVWSRIAQVLVFGIIVDGITAVMWVTGIGTYNLPLVVGFAITGLLLFSLSKIPDRPQTHLWQISHAVLLGLTQGFALLPGISRFASTFTMLRFCGYSNKQALPVSFLVQWPLIVAGSIKGLFALRHQPELLQQLFDPRSLFVIVASGIASYFILGFVQSFTQRNELWKLSWYMIILIIITIIIG